MLVVRRQRAAYAATGMKLFIVVSTHPPLSRSLPTRPSPLPREKHTVVVVKFVDAIVELHVVVANRNC